MNEVNEKKKKGKKSAGQMKIANKREKEREKKRKKKRERERDREEGVIRSAPWPYIITFYS